MLSHVSLTEQVPLVTNYDRNMVVHERGPAPSVDMKSSF